METGPRKSPEQIKREAKEKYVFELVCEFGKLEAQMAEITGAPQIGHRRFISAELRGEYPKTGVRIRFTDEDTGEESWRWFGIWEDDLKEEGRTGAERQAGHILLLFQGG